MNSEELGMDVGHSELTPDNPSISMVTLNVRNKKYVNKTNVGGIQLSLC